MRERSPRLLDAEALWSFALRALGARAHSRGELRQKLLRRSQSAEDVEAVLARLQEHGYLDDRRFAVSFSASRLENEGFGKQRVLSDLRKRRVAPRLAEQAVEETYRGAEESQLVQNYLRRKYRNTDLAAYLAEPKHLVAAYRRLRAAGFRSGAIVRTLRQFAQEPETLDAIEEPEEPGGDTG